nr:hyp [Cotesia vestalis bracovirus]
MYKLTVTAGSQHLLRKRWLSGYQFKLGSLPLTTSEFFYITVVKDCNDGSRLPTCIQYLLLRTKYILNYL